MIPNDTVLVLLIAGAGWGLAVAFGGGMWFVIVMARRKLRAVSAMCVPAPLSAKGSGLAYEQKPPSPQCLVAHRPLALAPPTTAKPAVLSAPRAATHAAGTPLAALMPPTVEPLTPKRRGARWWPSERPAREPAHLRVLPPSGIAPPLVVHAHEVLPEVFRPTAPPRTLLGFIRLKPKPARDAMGNHGQTVSQSRRVG